MLASPSAAVMCDYGGCMPAMHDVELLTSSPKTPDCKAGLTNYSGKRGPMVTIKPLLHCEARTALSLITAPRSFEEACNVEL